MYKQKRVACVVPARLKSTRFPEKILSQLHGKPMLEWIYDAAKECELFDEIVFAVDDAKVFDLVSSFNAKAIMTDVNHLNGTSRMIELLEKDHIQADVWVNWQGDEPLIRKPLILDLLQSIEKPGQVWTLKRKITSPELLNDTSVVKVVCNKEEEAMYFSRNPIPFDVSDPLSAKYKHIGIYAFSNEALKLIANLSEADCEKKESLEQLRFLYHGLKVKVHTTKYETYGIDTKEHLNVAVKKLEKTLKTQSALTA